MYNVKIYSYTNTGSLIDFKTTSVPTVNFATLPAVVTSPVLTLTGSTTSNITWTFPALTLQVTSTLVFIKATSAITAGTPTNAPSAYTANTAFSSGTVYQGDAGAYCVYNGDGTSVSVTGLTGNTTYHILIYTVVDASNSDVTNSYSAGATANGTTSKIEPSNQPTAYAVGAVTTANIPLTWVAAVAGSQAPDGYLIKLSTSSVTDPIDGTDPSDVTNVSGGSGNKKVTPGSATGYSSFTNWTAGTMYNFKIYSYSNSGTNINFNLNSPPAINHATLPAAVTGTSFTVTGTTTANVSWTLPGAYNSGNHSTLVFVKSASSITTGTPTNSPSVYTANTAFGSGTQYQNDATAFCVYNGDGTSVSITGLAANSTYYVLIYTVVDASNSNSTNSYSASASQSGTTAKIEPENQVTNFAVGGVTTSSIPLNWTPAVAGSQAPDKYLIKLNTSPNAVFDPS
ncbi:MAG: hypothetical protein IPH20_25695 [Bacteroidales bacterium]|nr:hypothetical protein [Bacteroidales bacterium]